MSQKFAIALVVAGMLAGAGMMAAVGLRSATAESSGQAGSWEMVAQHGNYPQPAAWRLNTATGAMDFCTVLGSEWKCLPVNIGSN